MAMLSGEASARLSPDEIKASGLAYIPKDYDAELYKIRHSMAHVLAQAVRAHYRDEGDVKFAIGPPVKDGFYYDFLLPRPLREEELPEIQRRMRQIIKQGYRFTPREVDSSEARTLFADQEFKLELIDGLASAQVDDNGNPIEDDRDPAPITIYTQGDFTDLCRGPHVETTKDLNRDAFKVLRTSAAYWRGDPERASLTRIYGTAWRTKEELDHYEWVREEAEKRDHRRIGKQLEIFHLDRTAPGMPYWLPKGMTILNELLAFWREEHAERGYQEVSTPLINERGLWDTSGHWEYYRDDMFLIPVDENVTYGVKPMNCPNAMVIFNLKTRSYRDLPLRLSDADILHRNEASGALHGLLRVRKFQQDDAHIFIKEEQIEEEYDRILEICNRFYSVFGLEYSLRLGTRPEKFLGDVETWDKAEAALRRILDKHAGPGRYAVAEGDGAFYGPKIDILMHDCLGRDWQMGTVQLDYQLARRFGCEYVDEDGSRRTPVVVHRVIYGSLERFIGILIEHTMGAFPTWISPEQARLIPIADRHMDFCRDVVARLRRLHIRADIDESSNRMNAKVRQAQLEKVPYILVVGDREVETDAVAMRLRTNENLGAMPVADAIAKIRAAIDTKAPL